MNDYERELAYERRVHGADPREQSSELDAETKAFVARIHARIAARAAKALKKEQS